ncbi:MAG: hypothetical protein H0T69_07105 [Thermoleophilaceae bacterium]|nr:hypothetical protein [Thermoleophilaceae bacterium]
MGDVIRVAANASGAVHLGAGRGEAQKALKRVNEQIIVGNHPAVVQTLPAIGRVVHRALTPLAERVRSEVGMSQN